LEKKEEAAQYISDTADKTANKAKEVKE